MDVWDILIDSLWYEDARGRVHMVPGHRVVEWLALAGADYDEVDAIYADSEVIGG